MMKALYSINIKLWLSILAALVFLLFSVIITFHTYYTQLDTLIRSSQESLSQELPIFSHKLERALSANNTENATFALNTKMSRVNYQHVLVLDPDGHIIAAPERHMQTQHFSKFDLPINFKLLQTALAQNARIIEFNESKFVFEAYFPLQFQHRDETKTAILFATYHIAHEVQSVLEIGLNKSFIVALLLLCLICLTAMFVYAFITKPINQLIYVGQKLRSLDFSQRAKIEGSGELKLLADNFNDMADNLQEKIAAQKAAELYALSKHNLLESIFSALPDLFIVIDSQGKVIEFSNSHQNDMFVESPPLIGCDVTTLLPNTIMKRFNGAIKETRKYKKLTCIEYPFTHRHQEKFMEARMSVMPLSSHVVIVLRDITQRKRQEELIFHHAFFDTLTNLPNRFLVMERLTQQIKTATRNKTIIAVIFIDLDDFKKVNDSLGHEIGDKLLIASAQRLQDTLRDEDTVARLGGDEFVILINNLHNSEDIIPIAANLVRRFRIPLNIDKREFSISLSLGVSVYPQDGSTPSTLLRKADSAMYHSKQQGRNTYSFFTEKMSQDLSRRLLLEEHMRHALEHGEFEVYYQPQFTIDNNELIGAEALLRWHNKTLGTVSPSEFIPLAESNGEIVAIGKFVLQSAIKQIKKWQSVLERPLKVAVNLSPRQFKDRTLIEDIHKYIQQSQIPTSLLELEITEGVLLSGDDALKDSLDNLHQLGLVISMDDFGTGYSSLNYLRQYPFDILKIDQSFIADLSTSQAADELVNSIITMSHSLGIRVVAEGIETLSQLKILQNYQCDVGQGFLLGEPMTSEDFEHSIGITKERYSEG
ncbi:EAL domain-containing protein [Pseudoalteromonas sp. MMG022]|uniref:EAL domain-containing protein n=1 Tax=Pseudoalteromonas sp. MMG022 TaxID=2909978 RepID=UPI001F3D8DB9|nr:EAL domain-containing protein [Pseudoalteromonas sp. MMG022]MCF6435643.1 EAL domain-containing protein [Pseudoalteromonas sp. MMG022]